MSRSRRVADMTRLAVVVACVIAMAAVALAAPRKNKTQDQVWVRSDLASLHLESIAMLPVATYDHSLEAEKAVAQGIGGALRSSGHRWISAATTRELLRGDAAAESLMKQVHEGVLRTGRVDSLLAPALCARLRIDAVLAVRVDQWEQRRLEWNEAGKPSTTIQLRAALVDSLGRLVWTAAGGETGEGTHQDPTTGALGVKGGTLNMEPLTNQGGPPAFADVLNRIMVRWGPQFPVKGAAAPADAAPKTP